MACMGDGAACVGMFCCSCTQMNLIDYQMHRVSDQQCPSIQSRNYDTV